MGTMLRCTLLALALTLWLIFGILLQISSASLSSNRNRGVGTINRWYLENNRFSETPYTDCTNSERVSGAVAQVTKVQVEGCDNDPCELKAGSSATFHLSFIPNQINTKITAVVHGVIGIVPVPFHIPQSDACVNSGLSCPLQVGQEYNYTASIPVLKNYPKISVKVKWELVNEDSQDIVCVLIPAKIVM